MNSDVLVDADHHRAVAVLKEAGNDVTMVVARVTETPAVTFQQPVRINNNNNFYFIVYSAINSNQSNCSAALYKE